MTSDDQAREAGRRMTARIRAREEREAAEHEFEQARVARYEADAARAAVRFSPQGGLVTITHTCGGPVFGKLTPGCPRCDELAAGAEPIRQPWRGSRQREDQARRGALRAHFTGQRHLSGGCGPVCTYGEW